MTKSELKGLNNLKIVEENDTTIHIHCKDGYVIYTISEFTDTKRVEDKDVEFINYDLSGSNCFFFPILNEYPKYKSITKAEYDILFKEWETLSVDARKIKYDNF